MSRLLFSVGSNGPSLLKVVEYGILGGLAGMPVSVVFRDFPYDLLGQLSAAVRRALPKDQVAEVWTQADVQRFRKELNTLRAVLVYSGNGKAVSANVFDWLIQHRRGGYQPLPAVISAYSRTSSESQGTSLVIQAD